MRTFQDRAEMSRIDRNGNEVLAAIYSLAGNRWISL